MLYFIFPLCIFTIIDPISMSELKKALKNKIRYKTHGSVEMLN